MNPVSVPLNSLTKQLKYGLRRLVRLRQSSKATLGQDVELRQLSSFLSNVGVTDSGFRSPDTDRHRLRLRDGETQPVHCRTGSTLDRTERTDSGLQACDSGGRVGLVRDVLRTDSQTLGVDGCGQSERYIGDRRRSTGLRVTHEL